MAVTRKKIRTDYEKDILTGCIINNKFTKVMAPILRNNLNYFKASHIKMCLTWCLDYYDEYDDVPALSIQDIFNSKAESLHKEEDAEIIEDLLEDISDKFEETDGAFNADYQITRAVDYCTKMSLLNVCSEVKGLAETGNLPQAESKISNYSKVESRVTDGINVDSEDADLLRKELYSPESSVAVMEFKGALGKLMGRFERGALYLIVASSKVGKSFFILDLAKLCKIAGLKVSVYSFEMPREKLIERYDMNISKSTLYESENVQEDVEYFQNRKQEGDDFNSVFVPKFNELNEIVYDKQKTQPLTADRAIRSNTLFKRQYRKGEINFYDVSISGSTVESIKAIEEADATSTGRPSDIIFIDSIYHMTGGSGKSEHEILANLHWRVKQEIGGSMKKCIVSPFQFNRGALKEVNPDESSMASSYNVFHHASVAIFLRASTQELQKGVMRVAANGRDGNYGRGDEVIVTRCLDIGRGFIDSRWKKVVPNYEEIVNGETVTEEDNEEMKEISLKDVQ